jgi:hypothetical protein
MSEVTYIDFSKKLLSLNEAEWKREVSSYGSAAIVIDLFTKRIMSPDSLLLPDTTSIPMNARDSGRATPHSRR